MNFDELKQQCLACQRCGLCETRTHVVFGQGVPDAEVLFVGEGPGANEDAQGLPFVGRSGQLLDHCLLYTSYLACNLNSNAANFIF